MKAAPFEYARPHAVAEACVLLEADPDAVIIAGGQTLVPMMAMRLARPTRLIDIARIPELRGIRDAGDAIAIGATTRQAEAATDFLIAAKVPLLAAALPWVGHAATRNRGTVGGSVANADPAAEIPLVLVVLEGEIIVHDSKGERMIAARDFFIGPMMTAMTHASCITEIRFPSTNGGRVGVGFQEISARRSDFALAAAAAQVVLDGDGRCIACAVGVGGVTEVPIRLDGAAANLIESTLSDAEIGEALRHPIGALEIMTSPYASDGYRRRAARVLAARALADARDDARSRIGRAAS
jgi:CO/xanthine dehydrogenase FAD-binding subunit